MAGADPQEPPVEEPQTTQVEDRDDLKAGAVREIREVRREMRERRAEAQHLYLTEGRFSKADRESYYLGGIQDFIIELERFYDGTVCQEYWEPDIGEPIATLQRPGFRKDDVMDPCGVTPQKYPRLRNPEALDSEVLDVVSCLPDLLEYKNARVSFSVELQPVSHRVDDKEVRDTLVIPRPTLDRARRWALDFYKKAGLGLDEHDAQEGGFDYSDLLQEGPPNGDGEAGGPDP